MKLKIICISAILLMLIPVSAFSQESREDKFKKGTELFTAGKYDDALNLWKEIYSTGYKSAELDYNIGNACFKLNNTPQAILFYERAHLLKPGDEDIMYNLAIARTLVVDRFNEIPELFFVRWFNFLSLIFSSDTWAKLSISAFVLCLIMLSAYFYSTKHSFKVAGFWLAVVFLLVSGISITLSLRNRSLVYKGDKAIIFNAQVNGKSSPDASGTDLFVLHEGTKVTVGEKVGDWYEIRLSDGNKGWIPVNSLEII